MVDAQLQWLALHYLTLFCRVFPSEPHSYSASWRQWPAPCPSSTFLKCSSRLPSRSLFARDLFLPPLPGWSVTRSFQIIVPACIGGRCAPLVQMNERLGAVWLVPNVFICKRALEEGAEAVSRRLATGKNPATYTEAAFGSKSSRGSDLSNLAPFEHPTKAFREAHSSHAPLRAHQPADVLDRNKALHPSLQIAVRSQRKSPNPAQRSPLFLGIVGGCVSPLLSCSPCVFYASGPSTTWTGTW